MKLALLLAQYLYANKRLDLPGIGTFLLDPSVNIDPENDKNAKKDFGEGITFENNSTIKDNTSLVDFISSTTGKIKALAAADLDSHLWLGQQFLNIGKPFMLDGIGSLVKNQAGQFVFNPGSLTPEALKEYSSPKHGVVSDKTEDDYTDYSDILRPRKERMQWKKPLIVLLVLAGIFVAIWGGYTIYKNNSRAETTDSITTASEKKEPLTTSVTDTTGIRKENSISATTNTVSVPVGNYKFIVETAGKVRALKRYQKLKNLPTDVRMETTDSVTFKLYFFVPATAADTARIRDSLRMYYTPKWSTAYVEY